MTNFGRLNLMNAAFARDERPIDEECQCYTCRTFSRAYLRHLIVAKEMLAATLLSIHNLHTLLELARNLRRSDPGRQPNLLQTGFSQTWHRTHSGGSSMTFLQSLILGIVQGLTEFLPVSSSAHLVLVPFVLNWTLDPTKAFIFDVLVQLGTLVAVIAYFSKDLVAIFKAVIAGIRNKAFRRSNSRLGWFIVLATIPAGLGGLLLKARWKQPLRTRS
jgi:hypothetical protein